MRKRWKAPNNPTVPAKQVWRAVYGEPWPKGWHVYWVGFMRGARGMCCYGSRRILLNWADAQNRPERYSRLKRTPGGMWYGYGEVINICTGDLEQPSLRVITETKLPRRTGDVLKTLVHEFTHVRNRGLRHGGEFDRLIQWGLARIGLATEQAQDVS